MRCAARLALDAWGLSPDDPIEQTAHGLLGIVVANMVRAIRVISVERGHDPREFVLLPFGGAGPLHAADVARALGISSMLVPPAPGILCARGLVVSDLRESFVLSRLMPLNDETLPELLANQNTLYQQAEAWFEQAAIAPSNRQLQYSLDMRYVGQNYELQVDMDGGELKNLATKFFAVHERNYGYHNPDDPVEIVNIRITAIGNLQGPSEKAPERLTEEGLPEQMRPVWFDGDTPTNTPIYDRAKLAVGQKLEGPAVIEQLDATTILRPRDRCQVDDAGNIVVDLHHD